MLFAILSYFLRFKQSGPSMLDPMQAAAYGMFLVHYPIVLWLQLGCSTSACNCLIVFVLMVLSWAVTAVLRKIPSAARVLRTFVKKAPPRTSIERCAR
jgi:hypothetical protein